MVGGFFVSATYTPRPCAPDGRAPDDVILRGNSAKEAFAQLQAASSLSLSMDDFGVVSAEKPTGKLNASDKKLLDAIESDKITVEVEATDGATLSNGGPLFGGFFGGSTVEGENCVRACQIVNPHQGKRIDVWYSPFTGLKNAIFKVRINNIIALLLI